MLYGRNGKFDVDLFTDGKGPVLGNAQEENYYSEDDPAENYDWVGKSFYGNPIYKSQSLRKTLEKANSDFLKDPENTSFLFIMPYLPQADW